jgi:hypothetical protein
MSIIIADRSAAIETKTDKKLADYVVNRLNIDLNALYVEIVNQMLEGI